MKYTEEDIKKAFKNKKLRKPKKKKTVKPVEKENIVKRHLKGLVDVLGDLEKERFHFTPKCKKCYEEHGWISICDCK